MTTQIQAQTDLAVALTGWPVAVAVAVGAVAAPVMTVLILRFLRDVTFSEREEPARRLVRILRALSGLWSRHPPE